jgi:hypothetical protein
MVVVAVMATMRHLQLKKKVSNDDENKSMNYVRKTKRRMRLEVEEGKGTCGQEPVGRGRKRMW